MQSFYLSRKIWVGVAVAVALSVSVAASYGTFNPCESMTCITIDFQGEKYQLTGAALAKFNELHNLEIPYEATQLQAAYVPPGGQFTLAIEGSKLEGKKLVDSYNIEVLASKSHDTEDFATVIGSLSKTDLVKLLAENTMQDLKVRNLTIAPVGGYDMGDGMKSGFDSFLNNEAQQILASSLEKFESEKMAVIIASGEGVNKVG
jgi:hypothetical protein